MGHEESTFRVWLTGNCNTPLNQPKALSSPQRLRSHPLNQPSRSVHLDDPGGVVTRSSRALVTADKGNDPSSVRSNAYVGAGPVVHRLAPHPYSERRQERWISRTSRSSSVPGVGKSEHWATALSRDGRKVFDKPLPNDEERLRALYKKLADHGNLLVVVDQPATIGALAVAVAQDMGITVGHPPGLSMRRIADLTPGSAKTDAKDAAVIAQARPGPCPTLCMPLAPRTRRPQR